MRGKRELVYRQRLKTREIGRNTAEHKEPTCLMSREAAPGFRRNQSEESLVRGPDSNIPVKSFTRKHLQFYGGKHTTRNTTQHDTLPSCGRWPLPAIQFSAQYPLD